MSTDLRPLYIELMTSPYEIAYKADGITDLALHHRADTRTEEIAKVILDTIRPPDRTNSNKRYRFRAHSSRQELLNQVFKYSYANPTCIQVAEALSKNRTPFYPKWKKVVCIDLPSMISALTGHFLIRQTANAAVIIFAGYQIFSSYAACQNLITKTIIPFISEKGAELLAGGGHPLLKGAYLIATKIYNLITKSPLESLFYTFAAILAINQIPKIPYVTPVLNKISRILQKVFAFLVIRIFQSPLTLIRFVFSVMRICSSIGGDTLGIISRYFKSIAEKNNQERLAIYREKSRQVWERCISPQP